MTFTTATHPPKSGNVKQLVIFLHGLGADGNDLIGLAPFLAESLPDAQFVSPNAPEPCDMAPFGYQWFSLQSWDPVDMLAGIEATAPKLDQYIDMQLDKYGVTEAETALVGFSQGTMMSLYVAPRREKQLACVLGYSGALMGGEDLKFQAKSTPPVCLVHGTLDDVVPFKAMEAAQLSLKNAAIPVESYEIQGMAHGINQEAVEIGTGFLKKHLGK